MPAMLRGASRIRPVLVVGGALALGAVACASVLGIGDRGLDPDLADGSSDAPAGDSLPGRDGPPLADTQPGADTQPSADAPPTNDGPAGEAGSPDSGVCTASTTGPCMLVGGLNTAWHVTSDANRVYWSEYGSGAGNADGAVKSCPLTGCGAGPLVYGAALTNPQGIAVDAQNIYFGTAYASGSPNSAIWSCPLTGCSGTPIKLADATSPNCVVVDANYVYWTEGYDNTVNRVAKTGGTGGGTLLYDAGDSVITGAGPCALDSAFVYVTDEYAGLFRVPIAGGNPVMMATGNSEAFDWQVALDTTSAYYGSDLQVMRSPKNAQDAGVIAVPNLNIAGGLFFDAPSSTLYWTDFGSNQASNGVVGKLAADGGITVIGSALPRPFSVTVSGGYVFWLSESSFDSGGSLIANTGALWRQAK